jgi:hypothetical protein
MKMYKTLWNVVFLVLGVCLMMGMSHYFKKNDGWIDLFNGKNLDGWIVKIAKHETGENYGETFLMKTIQILIFSTVIFSLKNHLTII